jgi:hypothetical protein
MRVTSARGYALVSTTGSEETPSTVVAKDVLQRGGRGQRREDECSIEERGLG